MAQQSKCLGTFSRMLDMGGAPPADAGLLRAKDVSKNSRLQAVAFDFSLLTRSMDLDQAQGQAQNAPTIDRPGKKLQAGQEVQPEMQRIQEVSSVLNVPISTQKSQPAQQQSDQKVQHQDIRSKYASKIKGGLAGLELAKSQVQETLQAGDAPGHLATRQAAVRQTAVSPTKWMALTGTGQLLSYLTHRSIRIALLPGALSLDLQHQEQEQQSMQHFASQLNEVVVDCTLSPTAETGLEDLLTIDLLQELDLTANKVLLVSSKDVWLKAARDLGMITCRLRPPNARRGNITTHYATETIPQVQNIVNEINGISFNAILNR